MSELLPCPFCGNSASIERLGDRRQSTIYACNDCGCRLETDEEYNHGRMWNRRAATASPEGGPTGVWTNQKPLPETSLRETWKPGRAARLICDFMGWSEEGPAWDDAVKLATAILSLAPPVEAGWKLVPVEPTEAMWAAAGNALAMLQSHDISHHVSEAVWTAMIEAAPPVVGGGEGDQGASCTDSSGTSPCATPGSKTDSVEGH